MSDEGEALRARQLAAQLEGEAPTAPDPEVVALAEFAQSLPWPGARPAPLFRARLRRELLSRAARAQPRPFWQRMWWRYAAAAAGVLVLAVVIVSLTGPQIRGIFGVVYDSLSTAPGVGLYDRHYDMPPQEVTAVAMPTAAPLPSPTPAATVPAYPTPAGRRLAKDAELGLEVVDVDAAVGRIAGVATTSGGSIVSSHTWYDAGYRRATIVLALPADSFESVLARLREVASHVEREQVTAEDVTDQYAGLQSQRSNLEATAARLLVLLDQTQSADQVLRISGRLGAVRVQVELLRGRLEDIEERATIWTITVDVRPPPLPPTPVP